ncbi:MAG: hypothetical protein OHK0029_15210 [Armatimonadaceae bacterium]
MKTEEPELNEETLAYIRWQEENPHIWGDQDENGVDLTRLRENLKLTPAERLRENGKALMLVRRLEEAGERYRATLARSAGVSKRGD